MEPLRVSEERLTWPITLSPKEQLTLPEIIGYDDQQAAFVVVINSKTGDVWVNEEREDKPETGKCIGDINVISETSKHGETALQTMSYGIIEEFLGTDNIDQASRQLHLGWFNPQFVDYTSPAGDKPLSVAVGVLFYEGPDSGILPDARKEVTTKGWMSIDSLLAHPQIRHSASHIVELMSKQGVFQEAETFYRQNESVPFYDILQSSFNLQYGSAIDNYHHRLRQMDVTSSGLLPYRRPPLFVK